MDFGLFRKKSPKIREYMDFGLFRKKSPKKE
jgi:hypothetical protein